MDLKSEDGMSLLSLMVAITLFGISVNAATAFMKNSIRATSTVEAVNAKEDVRRAFRIVVDCSEMQFEKGTTCDGKPEKYLTVRDKNGTTVLSGAAEGDSIGYVKVRAKCNGSTNYTVQIKQKEFDWQPLYPTLDPCQG